MFQFCKGIDQTRIVGRDVPRPPPLKGCVQCCGLHGCNKNLCPVRATKAPGAGNLTSADTLHAG